MEFDAVEFGYGQESTLTLPSLRITAGEKVAIIGENGAGKSTLARLIPRVYDVRKGAICVGGQDIRKIGIKSLREAVCYLPRDPVLFDGTISSNLLFVRPGASDREVQTALRLADLDNLASSLPRSIHQRIGPDGCQLSGGQRQRLAIARALLQRPQILILDEATSCLDPTSETVILRNVLDHLSASTLIVVSHRASTVASFDRVFALSAGRIVKDSAKTLVSQEADRSDPTTAIGKLDRP